MPLHVKSPRIKDRTSKHRATTTRMVTAWRWTKVKMVMATSRCKITAKKAKMATAKKAKITVRRAKTATAKRVKTTETSSSRRLTEHLRLFANYIHK